jgi:hypothetical protein
MALYSNSAFPPPFKSVKRIDNQTEPNYLFGDLDAKTQPWLFAITQVALTSNVATVTGTLKSGGGISPNVVPLVGAKMGVRGTTTNSGAFNVDPATVTAVTWTPTTGVVQVSYAVTHANVTAVADTGILVIQPAETPDLVVSGSASIPLALIFTPDESDNSRSLFAEAKWTGTLPTAATVVLQVANVDDDSRYLTVQNAQGCAAGGVVASSNALATIASSAVTQGGAEYSFLMGKFIRAKVLSLTGGDGTTGLVVTVFA